MARESALRQRVSGWLRNAGFFPQPVESDTTPGIPDLHYIKHGTSGWVELKHAKVLPKRATTAVFGSLNHNLSNEQVNWIDLYLRHGGRVWILAAYERTLWLVPGSQAEKFNEFTLDELNQFKTTKEELLEELLHGKC